MQAVHDTTDENAHNRRFNDDAAARHLSFDYIHRVRQTGARVEPEEIQTGGYYLYKEKFGMVCLVKVIQNHSGPDWAEFRLKVKKVLYSCWHVPKGTVFVAECATGAMGRPASWHLEHGLALVKAQ